MRAGAGRVQILTICLWLCSMLWVVFLSVPHVAGRAGLSDTLEYQLLDLRYRLTGPVPPAPELMIVAIDDATLSDDVLRGQSRRQMLAGLVSNIADSGAEAVALDVLLTDAGDASEDQALADALAKLPSVIAGAVSFGDDSAEQLSLIWPRDIFTASAQAGLVNLSTDAASTPRYAPMLIAMGERTVPSLALLAALSLDETSVSVRADSLRLDGRYVSLDDGLNLPLRYLGPAGTVPTISARLLLEGPDPNALAGKLVVLGFSAAAMGDRFATPFDDSMPGMEVIATAISPLVGGPALKRDHNTRLYDAGHAVVLTLLALLALTFWPLTRGLMAVAALACLSFWGATLMFSAGVWLSSALPLLAALPPAALISTQRYRQERDAATRSEKTVASLRKFQSPALARRIERDPEYLTSPEEQVLVVFFVDLTGFTGLSQDLGPEGTRKLLQMFHRLCAHSIEAHNGNVFNYMGDGVMAVFGLDENVGLVADAALDASFELTQALSTTKLEDAPDVSLRCRIGLHRGLVTLSRLGGDSHQQVTVTGDTVNFASRLMEVAKAESAIIAASSALCDALQSESRTDMARQANVAIRGRSGHEHVFVWSQSDLAGHWV